MNDLRKLLIEAREYIADMVKLAEHYGAKLEDRHAEKQLLARIDAALAEKVEPVPVEPYGFSHIRQCYNDDRKIALSHFERDAIEYIDTLQSALKLAQEKIDAYDLVTHAEDKAIVDDVIRLEKRAEKAESINRRMVEKYRDLVVAAEKIGGKVTDASNLQISIADVLSMKEALAKLEEA